MAVTNCLGKKGIIYTLMAIILVMVSIFMFSLQTSPKLKDDAAVAGTRVATMNDFMKDIQKDLVRGMTIAGYRSLLSVIAYETENGAFVDDSKAAFSEAFFNSTVNATPMAVMQNASFTNWTTKIKTQAAKIGISVDFNVLSLSVEHYDPWTISLNITVNINMSDSSRIASWNATRNLTALLSIKGMEDPVYIIKTNGLIPNVVAETDVDFSTTANLVRHINQSFYIASSTAPSYLMRLQGNMAASENGIESIVNLNEISQQGILTLARSNVDYIYFGNQSHTNCIINQTLETEYIWFRLDSGSEPLNHIDNYNVICKV
ncbi:hypothetical protein HYT54_04940 [Candidatus Woesearchaeota archaeon]|nr:hypothetical protein [Candidatus Woesearchaeota archaeon]